MILKLKITIVVALFLISTGLLAQIPSQKLKAFKLYGKCVLNDDSIIIDSYNPLACPIRFEIDFKNPLIQKQKQIKKKNSVTLKSGEPIKYVILCNDSIPCNEKPKFKITTKLGDLKSKIKREKYSLPFPKKTKRIVEQGYNGSFSHYTNQVNKYALDFIMHMNDTICATANGIVVGVIDKYVLGGNDRELLDYGNRITLFHYKSNTFSEYHHLNTNGSLVQLGDTVLQGQAIGLAGNTGYSTGPHLHFAILKPDDSEFGFKSIPTKFIEGYKGKKLKKGNLVEK